MIHNFSNKVIRLIKLFIFLVLEVVIFFELNKILHIIIIPDFMTAFLMIVTLSIINVLIWPVVSYFSLRLFVATIGLGTFFIDGIILSCFAYFFSGVSMDPASLFTFPFIVGIINSALTIMFNFDDEETYYRNIIKKRLEENKFDDTADKKGFIFLEIDGLAYDILNEAIERGDMPTVKSWLDDGSHKTTSWNTDLSSQTSSSQAGILHGNNDNIPAFRWVEKENNNRILSSNGFSDVHIIEEMISDGNGLLAHNGGSRSNLFTGDADDYILTLGKIGQKGSVNNKSWYYLFAEPFFMARVVALILWDFLMEFESRIYHIVRNIRPRLHYRGLKYFVARAGANILMREASTSAVIGDITTGKLDVVYTTYMGYDEIAHHSGIRDKDAFYALHQIDKQFSNIQKAKEDAKRDYELIVLSDHGQSEGPTFRMKYKITLEDLVKTYLPDHVTIHSMLYSNNDHIMADISFERAKETAKLSHRKFKDEHENIRNISDKINEQKDKFSDHKEKLSDRKDEFMKNNFITGSEPITSRIEKLAESIGIDINLSDDEVVDVDSGETIVLASGNLGLIYFTNWTQRLTYEQIEDAFPGLISGIASHPGIGFLMVKSSIYGTIVLSNNNVYYMDEDRYDGEAFLDVFGENIVDHLKRTDSFDHVPDILVNSAYDPETGYVYAFEELIGSHGGAGGTQQEPFILYPSYWDLDEDIVGSESVHKFFKREIKKSWNEKEGNE